MQKSESFTLSSLLSFSGGLQDAYTYNVRGEVFANAQTGNIVLMSQNFMTGHWEIGLSYLIPLVSFIAGIFLAENIEGKFKANQKIHWRQIVLVIQIIVLVAVGFLPVSLNMLANALVSFSCAMQVQSFRTVHGFGYASTMCIGNMRSAATSLSQYIRTKKKSYLYKSLHFFGIILIFAVGAGIGGLLSMIMGEETIWFSAITLIIVTLMMIKK